MPNTDLNIVITARNGTQQAFKAVQADAKAMGAAVKQGGAQAEQGLKQVNTAAKDTDRAFDSTGKRAIAFGAAIGAVATGFAQLGNAAREQDRLANAIGRAYGDAGDEMIAFSNHMQDTTKFSNDAVQAALLFGTSLSANYGLATEQIQQLTSIAADMAQTFGISLPDAMSRLSGAIRGEGEAAELLGLNMSDAAVAAAALEAGITNWSVPGALSEAEKGAFRFNLLMEQTAFVTGAAAEAGDSAGGKFKQLANDLQDAAQGAGQFLGPVGEVAAEMAPISLLFPIIGAGAGKLSTGLKLLTGTTSLLAAATSPVVLGLVGIAAAVGVAYVAYQKLTESQRRAAESFKDLQTAIDGLADSNPALQASFQALDGELVNVADSGNLAAEAFDKARLGSGEKWTAAWNAVADGMRSTSEELRQAQMVITSALNNPNIDLSAFEREIARLRAIRDSIKDDEFGEGWFIRAVGQLNVNDFVKPIDTAIDAIQRMEASAEDLAGALEEIGSSALDLRFEGLNEAAADVEQLDAIFTKATATTGAFIAENGVLVPAVGLSAAALDDLTTTFGKLEEAMASGEFDNAKILAEMERIATDPALSPDQRTQEYINLVTQINTTDTYLRALTGSFGLGAAAVNAWGDAAGKASEKAVAHAEAVQRLNDSTIAWLANGDNILGFLDEFVFGLDETGGVIDAATGPMANFQNGLQGLGLAVPGATQAMSAFEESFNIAASIDEAAAGLDRVLGYFDLIDSLGSRSSSAGAIADYLFGEGGDPSDGLGPLNDLLSESIILQQQFDDAVASGIAIQQSNLKVQEDLNKIRVDQLPILEEQQIAYEQQIDALSKLSPEQQRHSLLLQDSAFQAKLAQQYSTAYAVSLGEIPPEVGTEMILQAAEADADLKAMLINMGLINETWVNGEKVLTVSFPDGPTVQETIIDLTESINNLIAILDGNPLTVVVTADTEEADAKIAEYEKYNTGDPIAETTLAIVADDLVTPTIYSIVGVGDSYPVTMPVVADDQVTSEVATISEADYPSATVPVVADDTAVWGTIDEIDATTATVDVVFNIRNEGDAQSAKPEGQTVTITTVLDDQATVPLEAVEALANGIDGTTSTLVAELNDQATAPLEDVDSYHASLNRNLSTFVVDLRDQATRDLQAVDRRHRDLNGNLSTVRVNANTSDAERGVSWARSLNGDVLATSYINIVTRYSSIGSPGQQHGGIAGYAQGGIISELAEAGPEIVHFADGGVGLAAMRGLYNLSPGDRVLPANASSSGALGGVTLNFNMYGTYVGVDDFVVHAAQQIAPALVEVTQEHFASIGAMTT